MHEDYEDAKNIKERHPFEYAWRFQLVVEEMTRFLLSTNENLKTSLRYKRLFFLRSSYRRILVDYCLHKK